MSLAERTRRQGLFSCFNNYKYTAHQQAKYYLWVNCPYVPLYRVIHICIWKLRWLITPPPPIATPVNNFSPKSLSILSRKQEDVRGIHPSHHTENIVVKKKYHYKKKNVISGVTRRVEFPFLIFSGVKELAFLLFKFLK